ncbi:MAG TPA: hypothetical protein VM754_05225, partial [Actinomycetota bacterium]|nr:hypothetical protein [Actinomycetota bacterium]
KEIEECLPEPAAAPAVPAGPAEPNAAEPETAGPAGSAEPEAAGPAAGESPGSTRLVYRRRGITGRRSD